MNRVAIIGAGWSGLAAAVTLAERGVPVTVFEASRSLGGRARRVSIDGVDLDNGQHILIGAYRETLRMMRTVGADPDELLLRIPLELRYADGFHLRAPRLPYPLNLLSALLRAKGLDLAQSFSALRFMASLRACKFRIEPDRSVARLLNDHKQSGVLRTHVWESLCVSALNTPVEHASAQVFVNVLRDGLTGARAASDLLIARTDLGRLFPEPTAEYVKARGGEILLGAPVRRIAQVPGGFRLNDTQLFPCVVIACGPHQAGPLLVQLPELADALSRIGAFSYEPIVTSERTACHCDQRIRRARRTHEREFGVAHRHRAERGARGASRATMDTGNHGTARDILMHAGARAARSTYRCSRPDARGRLPRKRLPGNARGRSAQRDCCGEDGRCDAGLSGNGSGFRRSAARRGRYTANRSRDGS